MFGEKIMDASKVTEPKFSLAIMEASVNYMRVLLDEYGDDMGRERVNALFEAVHPDLAGEVMMYLLTQGSHYRVKIGIDHNVPRDMTYTRRKINAIKEVRAYTGMGLKEAKDAVEAAEAQGIHTIDANVSDEEVRGLRQGLAGTGWCVL